ncbi:MAG: zinc-ribbon domain-containing protein, partial [Symploca sp. SIO3E6]|nr:zinc-ribbon domain-containing protein [Caldora sp. SIO3E6]
MLICPKCQSKNQDANKFCQRCGTSLTQKACHECGTEVLVNAETCHNCGALTGTVFWAIISKELKELEELPTPVESTEPDLEASESLVKQVAPAPNNEILQPLDSASPAIEQDNPDADDPPTSVPEVIESSSDETVTQPESPLDSSNVPDEA